MWLGYISHVIKKLYSANINREKFAVDLIFLFIHIETGRGESWSCSYSIYSNVQPLESFFIFT